MMPIIDPTSILPAGMPENAVQIPIQCTEKWLGGFEGLEVPAKEAISLRTQNLR